MKIIIIGGVAGGASAAARLRRLNEFAEIILIERGENISYATCGLPYYLGGVIEKRDSLLVQTPAAISKRFNIDIRTLQEVQKVIPQRKEVEIQNLQTGKIYRESYDYLILSPGSKPVRPALPGVEQGGVFTLRYVQDGESIKEWIIAKKAENAVVVGGGFVGLEVAENLKQQGLKVTLIEAAEQVIAPLDKEMAFFLHKQLREQGIDLCLNELAVSFEGKERLERVVLKSGKKVAADLAVLAIGVKPETKLAKEAGLAIGLTGGILVDESLRTSDPFVYAIGDAVEVVNYVSGLKTLIPLAGPAQKQARIAADKIMGRESGSYQGALGTAIVKVFDLVAATTGLNERTLQKLAIPYQVSYTHPESHAGYYPGAVAMCIKLLFAPDGKILGAQIVGREGVDKRLDVLATCIRKGLTVYDLAELELAYAPPFSSAKDPVIMAGFVACNILNGDVEIVHWHDVEKLSAEGAIIVDIREPREIEKGSIPGSIKIPLNDLRSRKKELPKDRTIVLFCKAGLRSYLGYRILKQYGYQVKSLSGGYVTYHMAVSG